MNGYPSAAELKALKERYPIGMCVELVRMNDPYTRMDAGEKGTVVFVDDIGTVFVDWDCGSSLGVVYGVDSCKPLVDSD